MSMLNRRRALFTGAALAFCPRPDLLSQRVCGADTSIAAHPIDSSGLPADIAAAECRACSRTCQRLVQGITEISHRGTGSATVAAPREVRHAALECRDLCEVTAMLLTRQRGPLAPAICQSCADACDRLNEMAAAMPPGQPNADLQLQLEKCAAVCRALVSVG